jgi:hypothetical protein
MTNVDILSAFAEPMEGNKAVNVDVMGDTASLDVGCLTGGLDHNTGREDPLAILLTHKSASPSFSAPPENSPTTVSTEFIGSAVCDFLEVAIISTCNNHGLDQGTRSGARI